MNTRNTQTKLLIGASMLTAVLGGCGMKADIAEDSRQKHMVCTDTRDGERFSFRGETIRNATIGVLGADSCVEVTTDEGKDRVLCKSHEAFIKCENMTPNEKVSGHRHGVRWTAGLGYELDIGENMKDLNEMYLDALTTELAPMPWVLDQCNDSGVVVKAANGETIFVEDFGGIPDSGIRGEIIERARLFGQWLVAFSADKYDA